MVQGTPLPPLAPQLVSLPPPPLLPLELPPRSPPSRCRPLPPPVSLSAANYVTAAVPCCAALREQESPSVSMLLLASFSAAVE